MLKIIQAGNHLSINPPRKDKLISFKGLLTLMCSDSVCVCVCATFLSTFHADRKKQLHIIWMSLTYVTSFRSQHEINICVFDIYGIQWSLTRWNNLPENSAATNTRLLLVNWHTHKHLKKCMKSGWITKPGSWNVYLPMTSHKQVSVMMYRIVKSNACGQLML